jgi:uncharacterized protein YjbI with pentapeptide repeats
VCCIKDVGFIPGTLALIFIGASYLTISIKGFTDRTLSIFAVAFVFTFVFAALGIISGMFKVSSVGGFASGFAVAVAVAVTGVFTSTLIGAFASSGSVVGTVAVASIVLILGLLVISGAFKGAGIFAGVGLFGVLALSFFVYWRVLREDQKFTVVRSYGVAFGGWGGTSFCGADLNNAVFTRAVLKSTNFNPSKAKPTRLSHMDWTDAKDLNRARIGDSILTNLAIRKLLVTRRGHNKNYSNANLRGANLTGVDLSQANLTRADLSNALLRKTNLNDANLREANVLGTDFTGAYLTGTCIEAWNIDATTILENVDCQHIFLLEQPNIRGTRERRPSSSSFAPGEFTKLFQEVLSTIDLIFQDGIDWKAFASAFKTLQVQNQDTELTIQSIENKGDGVIVVRVNAPLDADKEKIHSEFNQNYDVALKALEAKYQAELQAKDEQITLHREKYSDLKEISLLMAQRPININATAESKSMNDSTDSSRKISIGNIGGDFNASGSALNLGDVSGTVTNSLNQLQSTNHPNASELADLLKKLQTAIENETDQPLDKDEALEQVNTLAQAGQNPQDAPLKKEANKAVKLLRGAIAVLPSTATLVKACSELLPAIMKLLSL